LPRFGELCEDLPDRPRLRDGDDEKDVTATRRVLEEKLLPDPGHQFAPCLSARCRGSGDCPSNTPQGTNHGRGFAVLLLRDRSCRWSGPWPLGEITARPRA
jgi:hypothetical protein